LPFGCERLSVDDRSEVKDHVKLGNSVAVVPQGIGFRAPWTKPSRFVEALSFRRCRTDAEVDPGNTRHGLRVTENCAEKL
jgi:hypothetical protein